MYKIAIKYRTILLFLKNRAIMYYIALFSFTFFPKKQFCITKENYPMLFQSAYYGADSSGIHNASDDFLHINNTGYYKDMISKTYGTNRPNGLPDWQIIYVFSGKMEHHFADGSIAYMVPGDIIIYPLGVLQRYRCVAELTSYAWVHFTGHASSELVETTGFSPLKIFHTQVNSTAITYIHSMIEEVRRQKPCYELKTVSIFLDYMSFLAREIKNESKKSAKYAKLLPALREIENNPFPHKTNEEYAALCGIDAYYFIHLFKEVTGLSPLKYATDLSMRKAGKLIGETDMDVGDISSSLGYDDPCYFSRKFRKFYGLTPSEYRKRQRDTENAFSARALLEK